MPLRRSARANRSTGRRSLTHVPVRPVVTPNGEAIAQRTFPPIPEPLNRSVAQIVQHLVQSVVELNIPSGERLPPERLLTLQLGVSRSPLREALKCLDILGFLEIRQGDGTYVKRAANRVLPQVVSWGLLLGSQQAEELVEARRYVEVALAGLAARRATDEDNAVIRGFVDSMTHAEDAVAFAKAERRFPPDDRWSGEKSSTRGCPGKHAQPVERVGETSCGRRARSG